MALIGLSLIFASVVYIFIRPPQWHWLHTWPILRNIFAASHTLPTSSPSSTGSPSSSSPSRRTLDDPKPESPDEKPQQQHSQHENNGTPTKSHPAPAAPSPLIVPPPPIITEPQSEDHDADNNNNDNEEEATTPTGPSAPSLMPPPPPPAPRPRPALPQFPAANSPQRARPTPLPDRSPFSPSTSSLLPGGSSSSSSSLAPPPTHSSKPDKPSRKVVLTPGHSPLDWARISGPNCDLRGVPPATPYLRVTPSMLKHHTGRKGKDAWMALNGRVYNVSPYAGFHPGGVPELMRGAARDATKLFGEIHPWVNYETMLSACLVGLLVDEPEAGQESEMDQMD